VNSMRIRRGREVPGRHYGTPKELWGFRLPPRAESPTRVARAALEANSDTLGLDGLLDALEPRRCIRSLGAAHVIFSQVHTGRFVHRAYVTVHMDRRHSVYLIKNRAMPASLLPRLPARGIDTRRATRKAFAAVGRRARGAVAVTREEVWFPRRTRLHLAYKFRLRRRRPAGEWIVYVDAVTGAILWKYDNLALGTGRAIVFDPNPVVALGDWRPLLDKDAPIRRVPAGTYRYARLAGLTSSGLLDGVRVTTSATRNRVMRRDRDFRCLSHEFGFEEVMTYFHLDAAVRYVESLGFAGKRAIFRGPIRVNARATRDDDSWYMPSTRELGFGTGDVDDAEDGETILHEFGHAMQDAICPDFGQSAEAAAMGEGFGDYLAASFFARSKIIAEAKHLLPCVMTWDGVLYGEKTHPERPPCVRRLDSRLTYESFDHSYSADEHANGEIWSATLWDIWNRVGRAVADRIIIESHFQLDGHTSLTKGARAIADADRNLFAGRHLSALKQIFRRRGIGPVE
jgi:Fungalysin metallopeptidase (M36)